MQECCARRLATKRNGTQVSNLTSWMLNANNEVRKKLRAIGAMNGYKLGNPPLLSASKKDERILSIHRTRRVPLQ